MVVLVKAIYMWNISRRHCDNVSPLQPNSSIENSGRSVTTDKATATIVLFNDSKPRKSNRSMCLSML